MMGVVKAMKFEKNIVILKFNGTKKEDGWNGKDLLDLRDLVCLNDGGGTEMSVSSS